jgi:hypothetical protein
MRSDAGRTKVLLRRQLVIFGGSIEQTHFDAFRSSSLQTIRIVFFRTLRR